MSDLISRKALIETIVNTPTEQSGYNPVYLNGCATRQNEIIDIITKLPPVEAVPVVHGEWIHCSERLPEERENPITKNFYPYPVIVELGNKLKDVRFYYFGRGHWWHGFTKMDGLVTHWFDIYSIPEPNCGADMRKKALG